MTGERDTDGSAVVGILASIVAVLLVTLFLGAYTHTLVELFELGWRTVGDW